MIQTCYVIDDEPHAVAFLVHLIEQTPALQLVGSADQAVQALADIQRLRPVLTFMDVDMPGLSGLELAGLVRAYTRVIFTTSFRDFAPEAFELNALDYLLKPFSQARLLQCLEKLPPSLTEPVDFFFVKTGTKGLLQKIRLADLLYVSGLAAYVELHLLDHTKVTTYLSLSELEKELPSARFSRIHKSVIVNHDQVTAIDGGQVKLTSGHRLTIGRAYRPAFLAKLSTALLVSKRTP